MNAALTSLLTGNANCARSEAVDGITFHYGCGGRAETFLLLGGQDAFTVGTNVYTYLDELGLYLMRHEACHVGQYDRYGESFLPRYLASWGGAGSFEEGAYYIQDVAASMNLSIGMVREICRGYGGD